MKVCRTIAEIRDALAPLRSASIGLVPTMGSLHDGHLALLRAARAENDDGRHEPLREPGTVRRSPTTSRATRATRRAISRSHETRASTSSSRRRADEMYPPGFQTWVDVTELGSILEGRFRPGHFRGVATIVLKLFTIVRPDARVLRPEGRAAGRGDPDDDPRPRARGRAPRPADRSRRRRPRALVAQRAPLAARSGDAALALPRALATRDREDALALLRASNGLEVDYVEVADFDPPVLAGAVRVGSTRLIDNVVLEGET